MLVGGRVMLLCLVLVCNTADFGIDPIPKKNTEPVLPIPILLTYKGSICRGGQCVMIYRVNHNRPLDHYDLQFPH